jgi:hypothetical protein
MSEQQENTKPVPPRFFLKGDEKDWARRILNNPKKYPSIAIKNAEEVMANLKEYRDA